MDGFLGFLHLLYTFATTPEGLAAWAGAGSAAVTGSALQLWQRHGARSLPALPSHEEAVTGGASAATRFFAAVHDLTMTVTEAWNTVRIRGGQVEEVIKRDHLAQVADRVNTGADELLTTLDDYGRSGALAREARSRLATLWSYSSTDNYRTEYYTETTTDSEGRTTTHTRSRQVYESTDHYFSFARSELPAAEDAVYGWLRDGERRAFPRLGMAKRRVDLQRLDDVQRSFLERLVRSTVTRTEDEVPEATLADIASQWCVGTKIDHDLDAYVHGLHEGRAVARGAFDRTRDAKPQYHYNTGSRSHDGPKGYQAVQKLLRPVAASDQAWTDVLAVIRGAREAASTLVGWANDPSTIEGDLEYARVAVDVYELAFPASTLELDRLPRAWLTLLASTGVGMVAAVLTWIARL